MRYVVEHVESDPRPDWLLKLSPDGGEVPALITDEGAGLFQSDAIMEYLEELSVGRLLSGNPTQKALTRAHAYLASDNYLTQCSTQRSPDAETLAERSADLTPLFRHMETELGSSPFFHGAEIGFVDVGWLPILYRTELIRQGAGYDFLQEFPRVQKWRTEIMGTGLPEASVPDDFNQVFFDFYLSEETYLGRLSRKGLAA